MARKNAYVYKGIGLKIDRQLKELADEVRVRIKPVLRDKLESVYRAKIYESRESESTGTYHHTGLLASNVYAIINGDIIKAKIKEANYPDKKRRKITTVQVYKWLVRGTKKKAKSEYYPIEDKRKRTRKYTRTIKKGKQKGKTIKENIHWARYTPTPKHTFNQDAIREMEKFIRDELIPALTKREGYLYKQIVQRYFDKRA